MAAKEIREDSLLALPTPKFRIDRQWVIAHQGTRDIRQSEQTFIGLCGMATSKLAGIPKAE